MRWLAPLAVLGLALFRGLSLGAPPFIDWTHDEVYFFPLARALRDPGLFAGDALFQEFRGAFPVPYLALVDAAVRALGSEEAVLRWAPALLLAVFLLGIYSLAARLTGSRLAGVAVAVMASRVWPTPFLVGFGIQPGRLYPRDVTTALLPWLLLLRESGSRRTPYFVAGLLAAIHPVSAPHVAVLLLAWGVVARSRESAGGGAVAREAGGGAIAREAGGGGLAREVAGGVLLLALGAAPYLVALARLSDLSLPPLDLVRFRMPYALPPPARDVARFALVLALAPAIAGGIGLAAGRLAPGARRELLALLAAAAATALVGALTATVPALLAFEPIRAAQYVYLALLVGAGALVARAAHTRRSPAVAAAALALLLLAEPTLPISALGRVAAAAGFEERPTNFFLQTDPETMRAVMAAGAVDPGGGRAEFLDLARFARERTEPEDVFLLPPVGLDHFRAHALRGAYVTWKDGGVILFSDRYARLWNERFREAVRIYAAHDAKGIGRLLASGAARYAVCDARRPRLDFAVAHENARYVVYGPGAERGTEGAR